MNEMKHFRCERSLEGTNVTGCYQAGSVRVSCYSHCVSLSVLDKSLVRKVMQELHLANSGHGGRAKRVKSKVHIVVNVY